MSTVSFLTARECAERLRVSEKTIRRAISKGELPVHRIGRRVLVSGHDFDQFVGHRRQARYS
jgi:excisionase family DNA binding protein